jgi:uncharacterized protein YhbP (UPF0306 family)
VCLVKPLKKRLLEFLQAHQVLTIAVLDAERRPHAAALFYAVDDRLNLYVLTSPRSRHGRAMTAEGAVAGTVQRDRPHWREIQGVQFHGRCRRLSGRERARAWALYTARFPFLRQPHAVLATAIRRMALWRIEPDWMRLVDNRRGFGRKEECTFDIEWPSGNG